MTDNTTNTAAKDWYRNVTGSDSINAVAKSAGIHQASLNRQVASGKLSPEHVVAIARAYGVSVVDGLIAQGLITALDITTSDALDALSEATEKQLVEEIYKRLTGGEASPLFAEPQSFDEQGHVIDDGNVSYEEHRFSMPISVLADLEGEPYAADTRRDHEDDPVED